MVACSHTWQGVALCNASLVLWLDRQQAQDKACFLLKVLVLDLLPAAKVMVQMVTGCSTLAAFHAVRDTNS